ncbi:MAG: carbohydrate ABC transporter permease [Candidatus Nanopelagicaceae bacterium]
MKSIFAKKSAFAKREARSGMVFTIPAALIMFALVVYPMLYGFFISTQKSNLIDKWEFVGAKYYIQLLTDAEFYGTLKTTLTFAACVVIGNLCVGLLLAVLVNQKIPLMNIFKVILMLPWLFPEVVVALIWKWLFSPLFGMFNYVLFSLDLIQSEVDVLGQPGPAFAGVVFVCIWKGYPIVMLMMMAGMKNIPRERYEAAAIDGANKWQQFLNVTLPGLRPILLVAAILETAWWFKHFTIVWLMTGGGPARATELVSVDIYLQGFTNFNFGRAAAESVIILFLLMFVSFIYSRVLRDESQ